MKTTIINLYGSPSTGKSTLSAGLFHYLKTKGKNVELVTEVAKEYAWRNEPIKGLVQVRVGFEQAMKEEALIGKVEYIITDSPMNLSLFYSNYYKEVNALDKFILRLDELRDVTTLNVLLPRRERYDAYGRFQTQQEAKDLHIALEDWLRSNCIICHLPSEGTLESLIEVLGL